MSPVDITAVAGVIVATIATIVVPWVLRRRGGRRDANRTDLQSWTNLTSALQHERDALQRRVDKIDSDYRAKMAAMAEDYARQLTEITAQLTAARTRISALETEVGDLYARLGRRGP